MPRVLEDFSCSYDYIGYITFSIIKLASFNFVCYNYAIEHYRLRYHTITRQDNIL